MKKRDGYSSITVNGRKYKYAVSLATAKIFVYDETNQRHVINILDTPIPAPRLEKGQTWRGKHKDAGFGKYEVAECIKASKI